MEFEVVFRGTPAQFGVMAEEFGRRLFGAQREAAPCVTVQGPDPSPDANSVRVIFYPRQRQITGSKGIGWITACAAPGDKTLLRVTAIDTAWPELKPVWDLLLAEMTRQRWTERKKSKRGMQPETRQRHKDIYEYVQKRQGLARKAQKAGDRERDTFLQDELVAAVNERFEDEYPPITARTLRTILEEARKGLLQ